jgi:uncharacterized membrane protein
MNHSARYAALATSVAALLAMTGCGSKNDDPSTAKTSQEVKCEGVNECKGTSECASKDGNACQGHNECKGKGWQTYPSAKACTDKGGKVLG